MNDVTTRLEQVSRHLERAQRVLDDVHTAVDRARHTVRNVAIVGVVVLAVAIGFFGAARFRR